MAEMSAYSSSMKYTNHTIQKTDNLKRKTTKSYLYYALSNLRVVSNSLSTPALKQFWN